MKFLNRLAVQRHQLFKAETLMPDAPFWAVGDVHGCYDLLAPLLDRLLATGEHIVLLGDYINKGGRSADVLRLIMQTTTTGHVSALRGNHEDLLLRFITRPRIETETFLRYGGATTFDSFGVVGLSEDLGLKERSAIRDDLVSAMGDVADWLPTCPRAWHSGNITALHAGADPSKPLRQQSEAAFVWGHPQFTGATRNDGHWVVHGHHPVDQIEVKKGRISLDTQAFLTGKLSAVRISTGMVETLV